MIAIHALWIVHAVGCGAKPVFTGSHGSHIRQSYDAGTLEIHAYDVEKTHVSQSLVDLGKKIRLEINSADDR